MPKVVTTKYICDVCGEEIKVNWPVPVNIYTFLLGKRTERGKDEGKKDYVCECCHDKIFEFVKSLGEEV